jgi:hypothetical protein
MLEAGDRVSDEENSQYGTVTKATETGSIVRVRWNGGSVSTHRGREIDRDLRKVNI